MKYGPIWDHVHFNHGGLKGQTNSNLYKVFLEESLGAVGGRFRG